jgi:hypothetical protein
MSNQMTPREHDDMRDLLLASTQRISPTGARRALISAGLALLLIGAVVGAVVATTLRPNDQVASTPTSDPVTTLTPTPSATAENPIDGAPLPPISFSKVGEHLTLSPDPTLTWEALHGALEWVDAHGLDIESLQGFQRADNIQPWTAMTEDGSGTCILIRTTDGSVFDSFGCDAGGAPTVVRAAGGATMRFTLEGENIDAHFVSR